MTTRKPVWPVESAVVAGAVEPEPTAAPAAGEALHAELRALITSSRQRLASAVNAELTGLS